MSVAQLAELMAVAHAVVGSSPIAHPKIEAPAKSWGFFYLYPLLTYFIFVIKIIYILKFLWNYLDKKDIYFITVYILDS